MGYYFVYIIYLLVSIALTYFVGNHLHKNGKAWLIDLIGKENLASRINDILLLLYRLLNVGYLLYTLMSVSVPQDAEYALIFLSSRLGLITMGLAYLHYQNIFGLIFYSIIQKTKKWEI